MIEDPIPALKQRLAKLILQEIGDEHAGTVGTIPGLDQTRASKLTQGRLERFSVQWLIRLLARINRRVKSVLLLWVQFRADGTSGFGKHGKMRSCLGGAVSA
ncbi:MAG TPA: hypothetical protein VM099_08665 [Gemmatimonadaceae bacterium]|nr:hypothetical protein [Gemmatimonadaceae bacterium]